MRQQVHRRFEAGVGGTREAGDEPGPGVGQRFHLLGGSFRRGTGQQHLTFERFDRVDVARQGRECGNRTDVEGPHGIGCRETLLPKVLHHTSKTVGTNVYIGQRDIEILEDLLCLLGWIEQFEQELTNTGTKRRAATDTGVGQTTQDGGELGQAEARVGRNVTGVLDAKAQLVHRQFGQVQARGEDVGDPASFGGIEIEHRQRRGDDVDRTP